MRPIVLLCFFAAVALAEGPWNVLVVVNRSSAASRAIADYYINRRHVPAVNVCPITAPETETVSRAVYESTVSAPVAACLKSRRLTEKILYIVTTLGVPLRIAGSSGLNGDQAAVDSELTLLYADLHGKPHETRGALINPLFGRRDEPFTRPRFPIYLVCRLAAYSVEETKSIIDRSLAAANRGRVVIDMQSGEDRQGD
ncbi:MAG TPA: TIGR03790 family protein, partial [Bryobacteraceae bacterium]|nr:TIGR03790 family protein [Bryobacteraceae bacterium]